jgi:predicted MFS family arabinose efflux permease
VLLAGALIDAFGTYRVVFAILAVAAALALVVFWWISPPQPNEGQPGAS